MQVWKATLENERGYRKTLSVHAATREKAVDLALDDALDPNNKWSLLDIEPTKGYRLTLDRADGTCGQYDLYDQTVMAAAMRWAARSLDIKDDDIVHLTPFERLQ